MRSTEGTQNCNVHTQSSRLLPIIHTHAHTRTHTHSHTHTHTPTHAHSLTHTLTHKYTRTHTLSLSLTHTLTHTHKYTCTHTHAHTLTHTHSHTHTHLRTQESQGKIHFKFIFLPNMCKETCVCSSISSTLADQEQKESVEHVNFHAFPSFPCFTCCLVLNLAKMGKKGLNAFDSLSWVSCGRCCIFPHGCSSFWQCAEYLVELLQWSCTKPKLHGKAPHAGLFEPRYNSHARRVSLTWSENK